MNFLENCLILAGLPIGLIFAGYWLACRLTDSSAAERIAVAALLGLSSLLWSVATLNFFKPLGGSWVWLCLWPVALTLIIPRARWGLLRDFGTVALNRRGALAAFLVAAFLGLLLWPLLSRPSLVFYDGTSNHDAFFWISAAEHLKRHTYMEMPATSTLHPLTNATPAIIGWRPPWGRMGAEGLVALASSIIGLAPVKLYLAGTATLLIPWIAAVFLAVRTFLVRRLSLLATFALITLQPVFVFFHGNANLPNLVGALSAAGVVIATERSLRPERGREVWYVLLALSLHGLLCSYPEMLPFVIMPGGLLWLRAWFRDGVGRAWGPACATALAWIAGAVINPASTVRAWAGFASSFDTARANQNWANLFEPLNALEYVPALATLAVGASKSLGWVLGGLVSLALIAGVILALRRATDRLGALFTLSGAGALLVYTLVTGFNYGWQKTVQFGGAFWAALLPIAVIDAFASTTFAHPGARLAARSALVAVGAMFAYATIANCLDGHKWSHRKILTQDWFTIREFSRDQLNNAAVLVDGASFRMAFFHGMWATYFLPDSNLYFASRGHENGGYLRETVKNESKDPLPPLGAYLVSRDWADTFDANSTPFVLGDTVALLKTANRVMDWEGLTPENGYPENANGHITLDVRPHSRSALKFTLSPRHPGTTSWQITARIEGEPTRSWTLSEAPPWHVNIPLVAGKLNHLELTADPLPAADPLPPFTVADIKIENRSE